MNKKAFSFSLSKKDYKSLIKYCNDNYNTINCSKVIREWVNNLENNLIDLEKLNYYNKDRNLVILDKIKPICFTLCETDISSLNRFSLLIYNKVNRSLLLKNLIIYYSNKN